VTNDRHLSKGRGGVHVISRNQFHVLNDRDNINSAQAMAAATALSADVYTSWFTSMQYILNAL
jgi:hypothetical protein